jgi:hypothetical protein
MKLYWATTEFHEEDWLIVADSAKEAAQIHEEWEGYGDGDAIAEFVLDIPDTIFAEKGWPSNELLKALGAKCIDDDLARVVEISGRVFCEGLMDSIIYSVVDEVFERQGRGRRNKTPKIVTQ